MSGEAGTGHGKATQPSLAPKFRQSALQPTRARMRMVKVRMRVLSWRTQGRLWRARTRDAMPDAPRLPAACLDAHTSHPACLLGRPHLAACQHRSVKRMADFLKALPKSCYAPQNYETVRTLLQGLPTSPHKPSVQGAGARWGAGAGLGVREGPGAGLAGRGPAGWWLACM